MRLARWALVGIGGVVSLALGAGAAFVAGPILLGSGEAAHARKDAPDGLRIAMSDRANPVSGVVLSGARPLQHATVTVGEISVVTDESGAFSFDHVPYGPIVVDRPGYEALTYEFDGSTTELDLTLTPRLIRAIHISSTWAVDDVEMARLIDLADVTTVNAFVFDAMGDNGLIDYRTEVPSAAAILDKDLYDVEKRLAEAKEAGLYTIVRIMAFKNPSYVKKFPQHALVGSTYLDPGKKDAWEFALGLAVEACELGFDEINFDYVRYPDTFFQDTPRTQEGRVANITGFLEEGVARLHPMGCAVSADSFGLVTVKDHDVGIGQYLEEFSRPVDAYAPMTYPELWGAGHFGLDRPVNHPREVVSAQLDAAAPRLAEGTVMRPWLRASWWPDSWILLQIEVAETRGLGWMMWNSYEDPMRVSSFPPGTTGSG